MECVLNKDEKVYEAHTLLIAVGNTLRNDDGAGWVTAHLVELNNPAELRIIYVQQLQTELLEQWVKYCRIIITDANANTQTVSLSRLAGSLPENKAMSHHTDAGLMLALCKTLYGKNPEVWICSIPGYDFGHGEALSNQTETHVKDAAHMILNFLRTI